ncbi:hypothetical protein MAR_032529 [Mya arenaria]|uniref:Uncharacterized protein n=1 Tax=Mya arenaria TaxID=6604 RepID=A0ABY7F7J6_MYAAR|nr:hypothetical protein MAR_032529 [Mya arenaria]
MENDPEQQMAALEEEKDPTSGSDSLGSSMNTSDFRRVRAPNKKKYDEEKEELLKEIANKDAEMKSLAAISPEQHASQLRDLRDEREASVNKRKKIDTDLRLLNQEITKKMGQLSRTESNLHYKNEQRIDDTIRKLELQLNKQNFRLSEERRVVGEIDKLKRSKKHLYRVITGLNKRDEELRRSSHDRKAKYETLKKELDQLHESKRQLFAEYKQCESEYHYELKQRKSRKRNESFRRQEEARKAKEEAWQKERLEFECQRQPYEDEINLCNTLIAYTQRFSSDREDVATKPLAHTPQILAQFSSLKMEAPVNVARIPATLEQLQIKKVPPAITETQTSSEAGESGFHDMSRQASKTESSESATDSAQCDQSVFLEKESVKGIEGSLGGPTLDLSEKDQLKDLQGCLDSMHLIDHKTSPKATSLSLECEDEAVVRDFEETEDVF